MCPYIDMWGVRFFPYGLCVVAGVMLGTLWFVSWRQRTQALNFNDQWFWGLVYAHLFGGVLGAKIGFFVVSWQDFFHPPWEVFFGSWIDGWVQWFAVLGAISCGWAVMRIYNHRHREKRGYLAFADYGAGGLGIGVSLGRIGCFLEGCCHGKPTQMPWGVVFTSPAASVSEDLVGISLHPTQLYEAVVVFLLSSAIIFYVLPNVEKRRLPRGMACFGYLAVYAGARFFIEIFRGDDRGILFWPVLSPAQWVSLGCFAAGSWGCLRLLRRHRREMRS